MSSKKSKREHRTVPANSRRSGTVKRRDLASPPVDAIREVDPGCFDGEERRKLTGVKRFARDCRRRVELAAAATNGSYSCTRRYGRSPYKMRRCLQGERREARGKKRGWRDEKSRVVQTTRTFRLTCAPTADLIRREQYVGIKYFDLVRVLASPNCTQAQCPPPVISRQFYYVDFILLHLTRANFLQFFASPGLNRRLARIHRYFFTPGQRERERKLPDISIMYNSRLYNVCFFFVLILCSSYSVSYYR